MLKEDLNQPQWFTILPYFKSSVPASQNLSPASHHPTYTSQHPKMNKILIDDLNFNSSYQYFTLHPSTSQHSKM